MKEVIAREPAEAEVESWEEHFDVVLSPESNEKLTWTVMRGRLSLDEGTSTFTVKLRSPIQLENGETVNELLIREPITKEVRSVDKNAGDVAQVIRILSAVTGQPLGAIDRLGLKDLTVCGELFNFFS